MNSLTIAPTRERVALAIMLSFAVLLLACASASASTGGADRYASPTGTGSVGSCIEADPCSFADAINGSYLGLGDAVILAPGSYDLGATSHTVPFGVELRGTGPASATTLVSTAPNYMLALSLSAASSLKNVQVDAVSGVALNSATMTNVIAKSTAGIACQALDSATIVNSVCTTSAYGAEALVIGHPSPITVDLHNVTIVGTGTQGAGIRCVMQPGEGTATVSATNIIARGEYRDIYVTTVPSSGGACDITLQNSNYENTSVSGDGSIVDSGGQQTAAPTFVNPAAGDFHQAAGSPTIDAGAADASGDPVDFDGDARVTGPAIDIGADEYVATPSPPSPPVSDSPPETTIVSGPSGRTRSTTAKFRFSSSEAGSTFKCQLDNGTWKSCKSPATLKVKPGYHKLRVIATDAAGNADATHAHRTWRVLRPR